MENLPESLLLKVFVFLPVKERCICGRVCKQWRRISNDKSLWRHVDLLPYRLNLKKTWKLIRSHLSDCLLSIKFRGFLHEKGTKWKVSTVSDAVLEDLQSRCPSLRELVLRHTNIDNLQASKIPNTLVSLTIEKCSWPAGWMKNAKLPNLQSLVLDNTVRIDKRELDDIVKFSTIEILSVNGCYRIGDTGIQLIAENFPNIVTLDISGTVATDLSMHFIARNMKQMKKLTVGGCNLLTNEAVEVLASGLLNLEMLDVQKCAKIDEGCVQSVLKFKRLKKFCFTMDLNQDNQEKLCHLL